jgi:hypothetical protein
MSVILYLHGAYYVDIMRRHCEPSGVRQYTGFLLKCPRENKETKFRRIYSMYRVFKNKLFRDIKSSLLL